MERAPTDLTKATIFLNVFIQLLGKEKGFVDYILHIKG